jgi:hypothetical protein
MHEQQLYASPSVTVAELSLFKKYPWCWMNMAFDKPIDPTLAEGFLQRFSKLDVTCE